LGFITILLSLMLVMTARLFHAQKNTESLGYNAQAFIMLQSAKILIQGCKDYGMLEPAAPTTDEYSAAVAEYGRDKTTYFMPFIGAGRLRAAVTIGDNIYIPGHTFFPGRLGWARVRSTLGNTRPVNSSPISLNFDVIAVGGQGGSDEAKSAWEVSSISSGITTLNLMDIRYLYNLTYTSSPGISSAEAAGPPFSVRLQPVSTYSSNWNAP
jgi:hypothetical protein